MLRRESLIWITSLLLLFPLLPLGSCLLLADTDALIEVVVLFWDPLLLLLIFKLLNLRVDRSVVQRDVHVEVLKVDAFLHNHDIVLVVLSLLK